MIHAIYIYFIVAALVLGYRFGDSFSGMGFDDILIPLFWLPYILCYLLWVYVFRKIYNKDPFQMLLVHLGINIYKHLDSANKAIGELDKKMVPRWQKHGWYGRYMISGLSKLKKMNNYEQH